MSLNRVPPPPASGKLAYRRPPRPLLRSLICTCLTALVACTLASSSAFASPAYHYDPELTEKLSKEVAKTGVPFGQPWTLTFNSAGNLFVADPQGTSAGDGIVDQFDPSGALLQRLGEGLLPNQFDRGVAVRDETGHVYSAIYPGGVLVMGPSGEELSTWNGTGTPAGKFGTNTYDAVDNSSSAAKGDLYVYTATETGGEVDVFKPKNEDKEEGEYLRQLEAPGGFGFSSALGERGIAGITVVDRPGAEAGRVYVADPGKKVVDRFSAEGSFEVALTGPSSGEPFQEPVSVAVNEETGELLVVDSRAKAVDQFSASGQFLGQIKDAAPGEAFEAPHAVAIQRAGAGAGDAYVSDDAEKKRVDVFAIEAPAAPTPGAEGVSEVSSDSASFDAEVNPRGFQSSYRIEYGPCESLESCPSSPYTASVPVPEGTVGEAGSFGLQDVGPFHVQGLQAGTLYHFRVAAHNAGGETLGEERTFSTQGAGGELELLDGRAWELVSPPDKHGASLSGIAETGVPEAAADGSAISYLANAPTEAEPQGNSGYVQVLSRRGPEGWSSKDIATPNEGVAGVALGARGEYHFFSADLESAIVQTPGLFDPGLTHGAPVEATEQTPYLRTLGDCESECYRPLVSAEPGVGDVPVGTHFGEEELCEEDNGIIPVARPLCGPVALGASEDLSHVVLDAEAELQPGAGREQLYEWSSGQLQLVSVLPPNGAREELPAPAGSARLGADLGLGEGEVDASGTRAISA